MPAPAVTERADTFTSPTSTDVLAFRGSENSVTGFDNDHQCGFWFTVALS